MLARLSIPSWRAAAASLGVAQGVSMPEAQIAYLQPRCVVPSWTT